ncbi:MAG: hypothetical protein AAFV43_10720 [Planctomycetota bacterium]
MNSTPTRLPRPPATGEGVIRFACPGCGHACSARAEAAGRTARCSVCDASLVVPKPASPGVSSQDTPSQPANRKAAAKRPRRPIERITLTCRHCSTRFDVAPKHEGRRVACPDCGVANRVVRPTPKPPKLTRPPAMDGEQYELYEGEDQPWGVELAKTQPARIAVACGLCGTLMHADADEIGQSINCPDCGTANLVRKPKGTATPPRAVVAPDDEPLEVEDAPEDTRAGIDPQEYLKNPPLGSRHVLDDGDGPSARNPSPPTRRALLTHAFRCWRSSGLVAAAIALAAVLFVSHTGSAAVAASGLFGAIAVVCLGVMTVATWAMSAAVMAMLAMELLSASSFGDDRPRTWPNFDLSEWLEPLAYMTMAVVTAIAPAALRTGVALDRWVADAFISLWLLLPIVLLSQLELGSPFGVVSPKVLRSLARSPAAWALFYMLSAPFTAGVGQLLLGLSRSGLSVLLCDLIFMPSLVVAILMEARLIGLLAWVLEHEATTVEDADT